MKKILITLITIIAVSCFAQSSQQISDLIKMTRDLTLANPKQASSLALKAIETLDDVRPDSIRVEVMLLFCNAEQLLGNFDSSIKTLYETQKYIAANEHSQQARLYLLMGRVYAKLGDFQKGIEFIEKSTSLFKSRGDSLWVAACYNERGVLHCLKNEPLIAEQYLQRALRINRDKKQLIGIAKNLNNLCLYKGNASEKIEFLKEAIAINKNINAVWSLGENYNNLGLQYFYAEQYSLALDALDKAFGYAQEIGAKELICDNYEYNSLVYAALGDYSNAYQYLSKMADISRQLQSSNNLRNIENEIAKKQELDRRYEEELKDKQYRIQTLVRNVWILAIITVLVILAAILLHKKEMKLKNVQGSLNVSRQETTSYAMFLHSRNELLNKIREQIKETYKKDSAEIIPHLKRINAFISQCQNEEKRNSIIMTNADEKNADFVKRLMTIHPNLTPGERYLATLLRANLSTKEIAMMTQNSPKSVNMNRYRLRKSLELSSETNLVDYLKNI